ncbi:bifunctional DNA primase/polymerase [Ornithinibacillus contaminans]|uniref:bifunctional DNA primase/polymerase n=1 Tax=Ornithinibacillus contaminans TaxID=694055 RepID=UPI00069E089C|nr:bifunctional DNA primase/polymerase [Ornithinibacillus contaminans]
MNTSILAALQLYQYGLTPVPLIEKRPLIKDWSNRFFEQPLKQQDIINGIVDPTGKTIRYDNRNIGILTGKISNIIVLDIDDTSLLNTLEKMGPLPDTWKVQTNRGYHLYFNYDKEVPSMKLWDKIDILSNKKQVVAPPSKHPNGRHYKWILSPKDVEKADLPEWLVDYLIDYSNQNNLNWTSAKKSKVQSIYKSKTGNKSKDIEELLNSVDWVGFYSQVTSNIRGNGDWLSCKCPFHLDNHNSFSFNKHNGSWTCFAGCGSGSAILAIQKLFGLSFRQSLFLIKGEDIYV